MRRKSKLSQFLVRRGSRKVIIAGVVGLALVATICSVKGNVLMAAAREVQSGAPTSSFDVQNDPKPMPKVAEQSSSTDRDDNASAPVNSPIGSNTPSSTTHPIVPGVKPEDAGEKCAQSMEQSQQAYTREVQKQKSSLDNTLSINFGIGITSQYVADYNNNVTDIFNQYAASAKAQNCVWPIKAPSLLSPTYTR